MPPEINEDVRMIHLFVCFLNLITSILTPDFLKKISIKLDLDNFITKKNM